VAALLLRGKKQEQPPVAVAVDASVAPQAAPALAAAATAADGGDPEPARPSASEALEKAGLKRAVATIDGPLERAIVAQVGREVGLPLVQVVVRTLVWWIDVPNGLRKGDTVEILYETRSAAEPVVHAVRFKSGKTYVTYRFKAATEAHPRFYLSSGEELEQRLENAPLDDYEQVSSLLRDGRGHNGVDFRTPVGTPVKAPFDGTVSRKTWHFKMNGNSLELKESGSPQRTALFLHLSSIPPEVKPGERVSAGQVIAQTGNTGHSFAPHLHYELHANNGNLLDPFRSHSVMRRKLADADRTAFDAEVRRLEGLLAL
jgi:murein DD-endopeptidase MepM/ murein hydrolase activator NlpD